MLQPIYCGIKITSDIMVIAVDFDGTIVEHRYPEIGEERPFATEVLKKLIADRHKLILWTMRNGELLDQALDWCRERGVEFYAVNSISHDRLKEERSKYLSYKLDADLFIDDRNVGGLPSWTDIYNIINKRQTYEQIIRNRVLDEVDDRLSAPHPAWMFWKK